MDAAPTQKGPSVQVPEGKTLIAFEEAIELLSREERFGATVYAMNTLLVEKGIYSPNEFELHFRQWAQKFKANSRPIEEVNALRLRVGTTVGEAERLLILKTLEANENNKTRAAEILGISLKTLHNKLREYRS